MVVPIDYSTQVAGKTPLCILKPVALVNRFKLPDFALHDEELLPKTKNNHPGTGGSVTRGPRS